MGSGPATFMGTIFYSTMRINSYCSLKRDIWIEYAFLAICFVL